MIRCLKSRINVRMMGGGMVNVRRMEAWWSQGEERQTVRGWVSMRKLRRQKRDEK